MLFSPQFVARSRFNAVSAPVVTVTWNASDKSSASLTLSNGNLTATCGASSDMAVRGTSGHSTGKYYFEITIGATYAGGDTGLGIALSTATLASMGVNATNGALVFPSGATYVNGSSITNTTGAMSSADVIGVAVDLDNKKIWFRKNGGNWNASGTDNPATNTGGLDISAIVSGGTLLPCQAFNSNGSLETANFGATAFGTAAPSGFSSWQ